MKLEILLLMMAAMGEILYVTSQECSAFGKLKFGRVKYRSRRKIARFRCRRKWTLLGAKLSICLKGKWNHPAPVCIAPGCDIPDPTPHLIMTTSKNDALLTLECQQGYDLQGPDSLYCDSKKWSDSLSTCEYIEPDLSCNFEESTLCGWTQYHGDNFDWTVNSGRTSTDRTGPDNDHTFGSTIEGHYLYIESSSPRSLGHKATILSPPYKDFPNGTCFEFYYHMKGVTTPNGVGSLLVYVRRGNEDINELVPSFNESGHQGEVWLRGSFEIGDFISTIQIVITGIRGKSYVGDIAIDDVRLYNCSDYATDVTTENAADTTLQWTTRAPEVTSISDLITPKDVTTIHTDVTSDDSHVTTSSDIDMSTSASGSYSTGMSTSPPKVVDMTTEETTTEMTPASTRLITGPTTKDVTMEKTTVSSTPWTTPAPPTTIKQPTAGTTKRTTSQTSTTTTLPTTTRPSTTTRRSTTTIPTTTKRTTIATTPKPTTTKATTPKPTTTKATTPKPTTTKATTTKSTTKATTSKPTTTKATTQKPTTTKATTQSTSTSNQRKSTTSSSQITTKTTTTLRSSETTKQASTKTTSNSAGTITTTYFDNSIPEVTRRPQDNNETDIPNVIQVGKSTGQSKGPVKPLMIGIGVGVAIGLAIVLVIVFLYMKKHRQKHDDMEDEMAPIARNAYSEW